MKTIFSMLFLVLAVPAMGGERLTAAGADEAAPMVAAAPAVDFPMIAVDQTRPIRVGTQDVQDPTYYDPDAAASTIDACKSGVKHPDKRCLKDNNVYSCITATGRTCGMFGEGTSSQICKTCV